MQISKKNYMQHISKLLFLKGLPVILKLADVSACPTALAALQVYTPTSALMTFKISKAT